MSRKAFYSTNIAKLVASMLLTGLLCATGVSAGEHATEALLRNANFNEAGGQKIRSSEAVEKFFRERSYRPAWTIGNRERLRELRAMVESAGSHGLTSTDYHAEILSESDSWLDPVATEVLATDAYLTLGAHLLRGKVDPVTVEPNWTAKQRSTELIKHLENALSHSRIDKSLESLSPNVPSYRALTRALSRFSIAAEEKSRPTIPNGQTLKVGMRGPRVAALRNRLSAGKFMEASSTESNDVFDAATEAAVGAFQREIGLEADGVVGPLTLAELNRSPAERIAQIRANLERWRWLAEDLGHRHIRVNIAEFRLETWAEGRQVDVHDVIVGRTYRKTPVFSDAMSFVVLNPWWETPRNIARLDKLPAFKANPDTLKSLGFEILDASGSMLDPASISWNQYSAQQFPFRLRQRPGPQNALGQVKLMFPNRHNVYLHDTPSRELFSRTRRDFSSGCVRVHRALDLTAWVLQGVPGWDRTRIDQTVASGSESRVNLLSKIPVHILYMTVVANTDGSVRFLPDIYDRDARLVTALGRSNSRT